MELCTHLINRALILSCTGMHSSWILLYMHTTFFTFLIVFAHEIHKRQHGCGYENQQLVGKVPWNNGKHMHTRKQSLVQCPNTRSGPCTQAQTPRPNSGLDLMKGCIYMSALQWESYSAPCLGTKCDYSHTVRDSPLIFKLSASCWLLKFLWEIHFSSHKAKIQPLLWN